jgi:hypothetical protein
MRHALKLNPTLIIKENHDLLEKQLTNDGHSYSSFYWTLNQVTKIEKLGFEKWMETENRVGYTTQLNNFFKH